MSKAWANRMRATYIGAFLFLIFAAVTPSVYRALTVSPTCSDGIQNQGETAVDLSGPCHYLNPADLRPLSLQWARSFMVVPGLYSAIAYIENPNVVAGIRRVRYIFRLYDERNILISERLGEAFVPAGRVVPVFEGSLQVGGRVPVRTTFEFVDTPVWERMQDERAAEIVVLDKTFKSVNELPRVTATIANRGIYSLDNLVVVTALFDEVGNVIGASRTVVPKLGADTQKEVVFTWPKEFEDFVARVDVIPLIPPIYLRGA